MAILPIILVIAISIFMIFVVNFVLDNLEMFQQAFIIHLTIPYVGHYASQPIQFMYLIAMSVFMGALATAIPGWIVNTRLRRIVKKQGKELENLQKELESFKQPPEDSKLEIKPIPERPSEEL